MKSVHQQIVRIGKRRFPALITGETGTGKELVARAIHRLDGAGPFVVIDCSSLVGPLMESEIFGHVKGAFTGAQNAKLGLLEAANGGTAFLDEVGELPIDLQAKLLRALQEKEFRPVGSLTTRRSDFRVIAATNRDLEVEVAEKRFRQDLYFRLKVMKIRLPALRERTEDIPSLVAHFLRRFGRGHCLTDEAMDRLREYNWPGNVRELEHTLQQMVAMNSGPWISPTELPSALINHRSESSFEREQAAKTVSATGAVALLPLADIERQAILHTLTATKGDRTAAAAILGIGRTTLYRKLKAYGMQD